MKTQLTLLILFCLFFSSLLNGQDQIMLASKTKGFAAGANFAYVSYENDGIHAYTESGVGYGVIGQYGINHKIAVALSYQHYFILPKSSNSALSDGKTHYPLNEVDITGKYIFGSTTSNLRPYVQAGFNFTNTEEGFYYPQLGGYTDVYSTEEYYGKSIVLGAGLSYFFNSNVSADLSLLVHTGQFTTGYLTTNYTDTEKFSVEDDFFNVNGLLGLQYHF